MKSYTTINSINYSYRINNIDHNIIWRQDIIEKSTADHTVEICLIVGCIVFWIAYLEYKRRIYSDLKTMNIRLEELRRN